MEIEFFEREIAELNKRFFALCFRMLAEDELQTCLHMNLEMKFVRAIKNLTLDEVDALSMSRKLLVKPAISECEVKAASKMSDPLVKTMYLFGG